MTTSHSPRGTPQMVSVAERWVRSSEVVCVLLRSVLPVASLWCVVKCAAYLLDRLPAEAAFGVMFPYEWIQIQSGYGCWGAGAMSSSLWRSSGGGG